MKDSWRQRMRWAKGFYQVLLKYGSFLFNGIFRGKQGRFACYDMFMTIAPAMLLTLAGVAVNLVFCLTGIVQMAGIAASVQTVAASTSGGAGVVASDPNWFSMATGMMSGSVFEGDPLSSFNISQVSTVLAYAEARATIVTSVLSLAGCFLSFAGRHARVWHAHDDHRVEPHPREELRQDQVPVHFPDLHAHLRPHRPHCRLQEGRVEADHA